MGTLWTMSSPVGILTLQFNQYALEAIYYGEVEETGYDYKKTALAERTVNELEEYFNGKRDTFTIPLSLQGTSFQKEVWRALLKIPIGETRTYKQVAELIGNDKAYRAVGMANNRNKIPIIVPCHRVIGTSGKLVGYAGGIEIKEQLLRIEKEFLIDSQGLNE